MTVALAAGEVGRAPGSDGVEAEYVDPAVGGCGRRWRCAGRYGLSG